MMLHVLERELAPFKLLMLKNMQEGYLPEGAVEYSHILTIQVCATVQGMVFKPFCQEQGIENNFLGQEQGVKFKCV